MAQFLRTITDYCINFVVYAYSMPTASHFKVKGVNEVKKGRDQWGMQEGPGPGPGPGSPHLIFRPN